MIAISADGTPIAYQAMGAGAPLVLLHGFTETGEAWREAGYVDRFLRTGRRVVLIDCCGHGSSGKPHDAAAYSGGRRTHDVVAVLDALHIESTDLVGYSMGGIIGLATALRFPDRVRALAVMAAHPFGQDMSPYRQAVAHSIEPWLEMLEAHGVQLSGDARRRIEANDICALQACATHDLTDMSEALAALKAPLLAIAGTQDPIFEKVQAFAQRAGGSFVALQDKNHVTAFVDVDAVVPVIDAFLRRVDPRGTE